MLEHDRLIAAEPEQGEVRIDYAIVRNISKTILASLGFANSLRFLLEQPGYAKIA